MSFDICAVYIMNKYIMKLQDFDLSYHPRAKIIVNIFWHVSKWMCTILKLLLYFIQPLHRPLCFLHLQEAQESLLQRCLLMSFFVNLEIFLLIRVNKTHISSPGYLYNLLFVLLIWHKTHTSEPELETTRKMRPTLFQQQCYDPIRKKNRVQ